MGLGNALPSLPPCFAKALPALVKPDLSITFPASANLSKSKFLIILAELEIIELGFNKEGWNDTSLIAKKGF